MNRVFVSYSRRNKAFTERLARDLSDAGLEVWVDWRQIHAGEFWQEEIFRGIERSDILVVVLSPDAVGSEWVQREVLTARSQGKVIIPAMAVMAYDDINSQEMWRWILDIHFIQFENRYEDAFLELLNALPGTRRMGAFDVVDPAKIPNPFKGLEAFQQTDAAFFFGRERLIKKSLERLRPNRSTRFLGVVGASGSGKSSLVRAGIIPQLRRGALPGSDNWRIIIFSPGESPVASLAQRLAPLLQGTESGEVSTTLRASVDMMLGVVDQALSGLEQDARLVLVIDQFEEVFTRAGQVEREMFLKLVYAMATKPGGRAVVLITMRADFFDRVGQYPDLATLFEQENMVIVTEMTAPELLTSIEGPAKAVGLVYDDGLAQRILEDVQQQPGSLPLLQYALKELYARRDGARLTNRAYDGIGGVRRALAQHAEDIYTRLNITQQSIMRRVLLRLIEVNENGEPTRRRVPRSDLNLRDVPNEAVEEVLNLMTSAESRLLIASREIKSSDDQSAPTTWIDVGHEALIREWNRFTGWVADNVENLRYGTELMKSAQDWNQASRDEAYLLVGNRLVRAEVWLEQADATDLQRHFIQASFAENDRREAARQRQIERELQLQQKAANRLRLVVGVLVIGLIVAIGLSVFALDSLNRANISQTEAAVALNDANSARSTAVANQQQAISLALAASANRANTDNDDEQAVMLAVEANLQGNSPPQSQRVLSEVAYARGTRQLYGPHAFSVNDAVISRDKRYVVSASANSVFLWDVDTGALLQQFEGHSDTIRSVAINTAGTWIVSGGDDNTVRIWHINAETPPATLQGHGADVTSVVISPGGMRVASADEGGQIIIWDMSTLAPLAQINDINQPVNDLAFDASGVYLVAAASDGTVRRYASENGALDRILTLPGSSNLDYLAVAVDPQNANRVLAGASDNIIRLWQIPDNRTSDNIVLETYEAHTDFISDLAFSADGGTFVSSSFDNSVIIWDVSSAAVIQSYNEHAGTVFSADFSADGEHILSASFDGTVRLADVNRSEEITRYQLAFRANETTALYAPDERTIFSAARTDIRQWNVDNGLSIQQFIGHEGDVNDLAISPDGTRLISAAEDRLVILWDVIAGTEITRMTGHTGGAEAVAFLPDGNRAISAGDDGIVILWDLITGEEIRRIARAENKDAPGHTAAINDIAISPDGTRLLTASDDQKIIMWDVETSALITVLEGHTARVNAISINAAGTQAVSGALNSMVIVWDIDPASAEFGQAVRQFSGHNRAVFDVQFSPDGNSFISGSLDGTLRLWDVNTGFETRRYITAELDNSIVRSVDFSTDGRKVLTGMNDATLREWRLLTNLDDLMAWTFQNRFVREPTCEERIVFNIPPLCVNDTPQITRTPFPLPTPTATYAAPVLRAGYPAVVNTDNRDTLRLRSDTSTLTESNIVERLEDGSIVTVLEGPVAAEGFMWWRVQSAAGNEGWAVESVPGISVQTLIPQ